MTDPDPDPARDSGPDAMPAPAKIALVVDDHPVTHLGCRSLLLAEGFDEVREARDMRSAYLEAETAQPALIVLDLGLPGIGGLDMIGPLLARVPGAAILIFSMNEQAVFAGRALENGARGYLSKNSTPDDFRQAVATVMSGQVFLSHDLALRLATQGRAADPLAGLTPREQQVLRLIGEGRDLQSIADAIHVSYKTAANVSSTLKKKLDAPSLTALIRISIDTYQR